MARVRMVTRTVSATVCKCMAVNLESGNVETIVCTLTGEIEEGDMLKMVKKSYDSEKYMIAKIISYNVEETLYGMPEADFIKLAQKLPPRGIKEE